MNFVVIVVVLVRNAIGSTHLVAYLVAIRMYLFSIYLLMGLIGPIKSNPPFVKGFISNEVINFVMLNNHV
jgi:hypothetical protein